MRRADVDVVVVGLGAVGGVAVLPLAEAGLKVVALEAGEWLTAQDYAPDEVRYYSRGWSQVSRKASGEVPTHRMDSTKDGVQQSRNPMMNAVGGTSIHYGAMSWRLNPWDFRVLSETKRRYGVARVPEGSTVEDWPLTYDELEPYYDRIEYELGVSGQAGNLNSRIDPRGQCLRGIKEQTVPNATLAVDGVWRPNVGGGSGARLASVPRTSRRQQRGLCGARAMHVPRLLRGWRLSG